MGSHLQSIQRQAQIFKALGHPSRLLMVDCLREGECRVFDLQQLVGDDISTVSNHLAVPRAAGVVSTRRKGRCIYYKLTLCCLEGFLACTSNLVQCRINTDNSMLSFM